MQPPLPAEIEAAANEAVSSLGPTKSGIKYGAAFNHFKEWCNLKSVHEFDENVLLAYFNTMSKEKKWKSSTLWSRYSMIKSQLIINHSVDISRYLKLHAFLKKANEGYCPKKSRIFTKEQFETFQFEAQDNLYLGLKIVLLIGVNGACRCDKIVKTKTTDIEDMGHIILVKIPDSKTKRVRSFTIIGENYLKIFRKYAALRPVDIQESRFFLKYQNGKCYKSVMGIHTISSVPGKVATFLKLSNSKEYTGHALRRTSATLLIDGGGNIESLKRHGGWKSSSVAEGYIEESLRNKNENAGKILNVNEAVVSNKVNDFEPSESDFVAGNLISSAHTSAVLHGFNFQNANLTNCTLL